ncbi:hypothetical protein KGD82_13750 [Nocardiopsis eucommiae]|uniref:Uncharacterized protein n=1 Tax=Nocardiopsis eucommiae TaxID=2831970 RepID=A0A975QM61_9ACTN|nr:hypothetical protein KGD82_13750 [Nocardiopsis eucommiae]
MNPLDEYNEATTRSEAAQAELKKHGDARARALAKLNEAGWSYGKIAGEVGLSRGKVQNLVERGRELD